MYSVSLGAQALLCPCEAVAFDARSEDKAGGGWRKFSVQLLSRGSTFPWPHQVPGARHVY